MDLQLKGRTALVTGASVGLGREIARILHQEGCRVMLVARRKALLDELADELAKTGERPVVTVQDITADDAAAKLHAAVKAAFGGKLDVLVNNAGGSRPMPGLGTEAEWAEGMLLNFTAGRRITHAFVEDMQRAKFGRIVNITGGDEPVAMNAGVPPNGAVHIWSKGLSRGVAKDNVTVNSVVPGRLHSEQIDQRLLPTEEARRSWVEQNCPAGYIGQPEDLAVLVGFLCSPRARYITGQVIHVDGGARRFSH